MMGTYTCAICKNTYPFINDDLWPDNKAQEEYAADFPELLGAPTAIVCDDCYNEVIDDIREMHKEMFGRDNPC